MLERGERGSMLSLLCDAGERYLGSYFDDAWVAQHIGDCAPARARLQAQLDCTA
jgi:cysteine synthase A